MHHEISIVYQVGNQTESLSDIRLSEDEARRLQTYIPLEGHNFYDFSSTDKKDYRIRSDAIRSIVISHRELKTKWEWLNATLG